MSPWKVPDSRGSVDDPVESATLDMYRLLRECLEGQ